MRKMSFHVEIDEIDEIVEIVEAADCDDAVDVVLGDLSAGHAHESDGEWLGGGVEVSGVDAPCSPEVPCFADGCARCASFPSGTGG